VVEPTSIPIITGSVRRSGYLGASASFGIQSPSGRKEKSHRPPKLGGKGGEVNLVAAAPGFELAEPDPAFRLCGFTGYTTSPGRRRGALLCDFTGIRGPLLLAVRVNLLLPKFNTEDLRTTPTASPQRTRTTSNLCLTVEVRAMLRFAAMTSLDGCWSPPRPQHRTVPKPDGSTCHCYTNRHLCS